MLSVSALMLILIISGMSGASAETYVGAGPATFVGGFDWNESGSPYIVNETIYVDVGETLAIGPGVTVLIDPDCSIIVSGTLQVLGNATHPVTFNANDTSSFWGGISLTGGSAAIIDHTVFENAKAAIEAYDCDVTITNSTLYSTSDLAPVYGRFSEGGSIVVSDCYIEAESTLETEGAITIFGNAKADGEETNVNRVSISVTNNMIISTSEYCTIHIELGTAAENSATATLRGDILISGNKLIDHSPYSNTLNFVAHANALDDATASIECNVTIADNMIGGSGPASIFIERTATAADNATVSVVGDLLISGNILGKDVPGTGFIDISTTLLAQNDSMATVSGDMAVLDNLMFWEGPVAPISEKGLSIQAQVDAIGENSTARLAGDIDVADNTVETPFITGGFEVTLAVKADGYGKVEIIGDVNLNSNTIINADLAFMYHCNIVATGNSVVDLMGDIHMNGNVIVEAGRGVDALWFTNAFGNATVNVVSDIVVDDNQFDKITTEYGDVLAAIEVKADCFAFQDAALSFQGDAIIHNNTVELAGTGISYSIIAYASERASLVVETVLIIEGNDISCDRGPVIVVDRQVQALGDSVSDLDVEVVIKENDLDVVDNSGIVSLQYIIASGDALVDFLGNVTIEGNSITMDTDSLHHHGVLILRYCFLSGNGAALTSSNVCANGNELIGRMGLGMLLIDVLTASGPIENATLAWQGDIVIQDNNFGSCGTAVNYQGLVTAMGHINLTYDATMLIENNNVEEADLAFLFSWNLIATGFADVDMNMPVRLAGNVAESVTTMIMFNIAIDAKDDSSLRLAGETGIADNVCVSADDRFISYAATATVMDNSTLCLDLPMEIALNEGKDIMVIRDAHAHDNAMIDAFMPTCVAYNTIAGCIKVTHGLYAESGNATVHVTGDVVIHHNVVEYYSDVESANVIDVNIYVHARIAGPQQVCEAVYDADVVITENEVSISVEGWLSVSGIKVYTDVMVTYGLLVEGPYDASSARAAFGNVLVTENVVAMESNPNSHLHGIRVDPNVHAYSWYGSQAHAEMGSMVVEDNEVQISTGYGIGIGYYSDYLCAYAIGADSASTASLGAQIIRGNLIDIIGNDGSGITIAICDESCAKNEGGARARVVVESGLIASGNEVMMKGLRNSGMYLDVSLSSTAEGGDACYEMPFALLDNEFDMRGTSNTAIYVVDFDSWVGYFDSDACLVSGLTIERNDIVMTAGVPPIAPGAPIDANSYGIRVDANEEIDLDSYSGNGSLCAGVRITDNTIEGAGYGIHLSGVTGPIVKNNIVTNSMTCLYLEYCTDVVLCDETLKGFEYGAQFYECNDILIENNDFLGNEVGLRLSGGDNITVRDNRLSNNGHRGLWADNVSNLLIENCYFYMNDNGAYLDNVEGVVGNNTFYMNINGGLRVLDCVLDMYNGEFDQNGGIGLNVNGGSVDWFVDAKAVVHASKVQFAGEIIITGTLVLDDVSRFELRPDNDVPYGIYAGYARLTVAEGGCLEAYNSVLEGDTNPWFFEVYGGMQLFNCVVSDAYEVYLAPSSDVEMTTTTVQYAHSNGIRVDGCSPIIRGCTVTGSGMDGIYIVDGAQPTIVGCTIVDNERGIYAYDACLDLVVDNIIVMNYVAGIYAERVTGTIHDNVFMFNNNELFLIDCDLVVENNQFGFGRLMEMNEPLASSMLQAICDIVDFRVNMRGDIDDLVYDLADALHYMPYDMLYDLLQAARYGSVGIYAIDSCVEASGNEYGMLQTAVYLVRSDLVFGDIVRTNSFDMTYDNGTRTLSIPFTVYDGIYAVDSTLTIDGAYFQVVDDAVFLENSCAVITGTVFEAGDYELYLFRDAEAAVGGELAKYAILDTSRLYWLATLTINVVDQDSFGIAGASVVVKDASGRVWSEGTTDRHGVFVAYAPYSLETRNGVNDTLGKTFVTTAYGDKATKSAEIDVDGDDELRMKMTIKESSIFGTSPLVLGIVVLVIVAVIVGAVMLARKK